MIDSATNTGFRLYFSENFIYEEIEKKYKPIIDSQSPMFRRLVEYLNMTICANRFIPGFTIPESNIQYSRTGIKTTHTTGLNPTELLNANSLDIEFKLKNSCINYFIMTEIILLYMDVNRRKDKSIFLPPIILDIIGDDGNLIAKYTYTNIYPKSIGDLNFDGGQVNLNGDTFKCEFGFNDYTMELFMGDRVDMTHPGLTY
jgi:hypothetical protein|nr:MAG TPA: baseplate wedge protein [Caudoviricetes sp.]